MNNNSGRRIAMSATCGILIVVIPGCAPYKVEQIDDHTPQHPAAILIGDPQVYSRASLINDRRLETEYLQQLLANSRVDGSGSSKVNFSPQIVRDLKTVQALSLSLGLSAGKTVTDTSSSATLTTQIEVAKLQAQLAVLQKQIEGIQAAQPPTVTIPAPDMTSSNSQAAPATNVKMPDVSALSTAIKNVQSELANLKPTNPASAPTDVYGALADPRDDFDDRQAYRRDIRAALAQARLDDVHDRAGNALYRLQFQATVLPPTNATRQWGAAKMTIEPPRLSGDDVERAYYEWLGYLSKQVTETATRNEDFDQYLNELSHFGYFNVIDVFKAKNSEAYTCFDHATAENTGQVRALTTANFALLGAAVRTSAEAFLNTYDSVGTWVVPATLIASNDCGAYPRQTATYQASVVGLDIDKVRAALSWMTQWAPQSASIRDLHVQPSPAIGTRRGHVPAAFCKAVIGPADRELFCSPFSFDNLDNHARVAAADGSEGGAAAVRAYSVLPTDLAQRLGVTTEAAQSLQSALSIAAQVSPTTSGGLGAGYLAQSDARAQALSREPLVVGFSGSPYMDSVGATESSSFFGWLFGPAFTIGDSNTLALLHGVRNYGVTADVSFPGWWRHIRVDVQTAWIQDWQNVNAAVPFATQAPATTAVAVKTVNLPVSDATYESLTAFIAGGEYGPQNTRIFASAVTPTLVPACASSVTFQISGTNIWRADAIYLGGTKATTTAVLPDMQGVTADFDMSTVYGTLIDGDVTSVREVPLTVSAEQGSARPLSIWIVGSRHTVNGATTCESPLLVPTNLDTAPQIFAIAPSEICASVSEVPLVVHGVNLPAELTVHSGGAFQQKGSWTGNAFRQEVDLQRTDKGTLAIGSLPIALTYSTPESVTPKSAESASFTLSVKDCSTKSPDSAPKATLLTTSVKLAKSQTVTLQLKVPASYAGIKIRVRPKKGGNAAWTEAAIDKATVGDNGQVTATLDLSKLNAASGDALEVEVDIEDRPDLDWRPVPADKTITVSS